MAEYVRMMFVWGSNNFLNIFQEMPCVDYWINIILAFLSSPIGRREIDAHYEDVASSSLTEAVANIINPIVSNTQSHKVTRIFIVQVDAVLYRLIICKK